MLSGSLGKASLGKFALGAIRFATSVIVSIVTPLGRIFTAHDCENGNAIAFITPRMLIDYGIDWILELEDAETITDSAWSSFEVSVTGKVPFVDPTGKIASVWVSAGTAAVGEINYVTNTITTSGGRTMERSFMVQVNAYLSL